MRRFRFVLGRLLQTVPVLFVVLLLVFALLHLAPGDPARTLAGLKATEESVEAIREEMGLNEPLIVQYGTYVGNVFRGDLGESTVSSKPVTTIVRQRLPVTLWLLAGGAIVGTTFALLLAGLAARRPDTWIDHIVRGISTVGLGMPVFWVGLMLILLVALPTGWFPVGGFPDGLAEQVRAMVLPSLTLGFALAPVQIRALRSSLAQVYDSDYTMAARSIGVSETRLLWRHLLRNAALPAVTVLAVQMGSLLFGAVVVEATFALPGLGQGLVQSVSRRDFPMVQGVTLISAVLVLTAHLLADAAYAALDPRVEV
ncbi:MAG: peptide/nickel transport system permease protein [Actinomycetota bacterium]|nr:peptide/nickel transport system permease protein [Actinomycetota bacterium]